MLPWGRTQDFINTSNPISWSYCHQSHPLTSSRSGWGDGHDGHCCLLEMRCFFFLFPAPWVIHVSPSPRWCMKDPTSTISLGLSSLAAPFCHYGWRPHFLKWILLGQLELPTWECFFRVRQGTRWLPCLTSNSLQYYHLLLFNSFRFCNENGSYL